MIIDRIFHKINSSKSHPYLYLSPHVYSFGNCADYIYKGLIRAKHAKKKLVILYPFDIPFIFKYKLTNRALFNIKSDLIFDQGKYVTLFSRTLMTIVYMPLRVLGLLLRKFFRFNLPDSYHFPNIGTRYIFVPEKSINKFSLGLVREHDGSEKFSKKIDFAISLNGNVSDGYEHEKIGIPKNSWFVCLHVRGRGFHNDNSISLSSVLDRNPNILNFIPAIKEITSRGGWVVRMGDSTMEPLPSMENVIDYPFTKYKSEFMDLCLIQNCRFFFGGQSGLQNFANVAFTNVLLINMYHWFFEPTLIRGRGIRMHVYSKKKERNLSIKELLSLDLETKMSFHSRAILLRHGHFNDEDYVFIENSAEEISKAVLEYMDFLSNDDLSLTSKQKKYNEYRKKQRHRLLTSSRFTSPRTHNDEYEMIECYRATIRVEAAQGTLCAGFLEENW